jgi:hypothetical protein
MGHGMMQTIPTMLVDTCKQIFVPESFLFLPIYENRLCLGTEMCSALGHTRSHRPIGHHLALFGKDELAHLSIGAHSTMIEGTALTHGTLYVRNGHGAQYYGTV